MWNARVGQDALTPLKFLMEKAMIQVAPVYSGQTELEVPLQKPLWPSVALEIICVPETSLKKRILAHSTRCCRWHS